LRKTEHSNKLMRDGDDEAIKLWSVFDSWLFCLRQVSTWVVPRSCSP